MVNLPDIPSGDDKKDIRVLFDKCRKLGKSDVALGLDDVCEVNPVTDEDVEVGDVFTIRGANGYAEFKITTEGTCQLWVNGKLEQSWG